MTNPFTMPTLTGYNAVPGTDTGQAGGSVNVVSWAKHIDNIGDPLRDFAQAIADNVEDAFENIFGVDNVDLLFAQASAPVGWTQRTTVNDAVLRVVSGTGAGTGGSWTITGLTVPSHDHGAGSYSATGTADATVDVATTPNDVDVPTTSANWSVSGTSGSSGVLSVSSSGAWRPSYLDVIRCFRSFG